MALESVVEMLILCSIIPNLVLKMGCKVSAEEVLFKLTEVSRYVFEIANLPHPSRLPYVGRSAFAHKGGVHVSAVLKSPRTYEHIKSSFSRQCEKGF